jgi:hypothetical protein
MSPVMVAAAAVRGQVADAREVFGLVDARGSTREQDKESQP